LPTLLGREVRLERAREGRFIHAVAVVGDREHHVAAGHDHASARRALARDVERREREGDRAHALADRLRGTRAQVDHHLLNLRAVAEDKRQRRRQVGADRYRRRQARAQLYACGRHAG
jgi:hypothetical protein